MKRLLPGAWSAALSVALLSACAGLPTAQVETPAELAASPILALPAAYGRSGGFTLPAELGGGAGRFTRGADRLSLFESVDIDRAALTLSLDGGADYRCTLRRTGAQIGVLALSVRPMQLRCRDAKSDAELHIDERQRATRIEREGRLRAGSVVIDIRSLHRVQGSPLPLEQAGGYQLSVQGQPVAVLDLLDKAPRLRLAAGQKADQQTAVRDAALLLALHWDPAR